MPPVRNGSEADFTASSMQSAQAQSLMLSFSQADDLDKLMAATEAGLGAYSVVVFQAWI